MLYFNRQRVDRLLPTILLELKNQFGWSDFEMDSQKKQIEQSVQKAYKFAHNT
jgi:hypothetical protein